MSLLTPEAQTQLAQWRAKCADGTITREELKQAFAVMRSNRNSAAVPAPKAKAPRKVKAKAEPVSAAGLLSQLGKL